MKKLLFIAAMCVTTLSAAQEVHRFIADEVISECRAEVIDICDGNINIIRAQVPDNIGENEVARRVNKVFSTHFKIFERYAEITGQEINIRDARKTWRKNEGVQLLANVDGKIMLIGFNNKTNELIIIW